MPDALSRQLAAAEAVSTLLSPMDALERLSRGNHVFIDVREVSELAGSGMIPSAVHAPRSMLEWHLDPDSDSYLPVFGRPGVFVFYCGGGGRSLLSAATAARMGVGPVASIVGGFRAWQAAGNPVVPFAAGKPSEN